MQSQYAKDGLLVISVNLDDPADAELRERVVKFLQSRNANTVNVQLTDPPDLWEKKLGIEGFPAVFVFNRQGKYARFPSNEKAESDHTDIEKLVVELLKKAP